jgi:hypothetical protein
MKKTGLSLLLLLLCTSLLSAQSLYELAQKEKQRRAQYKGKSVRVVTNADLGKSARTPAVSVRSIQPTPQTRSAPPPPPTSTAPRVTMDREPEAKQDVQEARGTSAQYASKVLPETQNVNNPNLALGRPDGQFAYVNLYGFLDLELTVENGPGDDLIVYARRQEQGLPNMLKNYYVYVKPERGDWESIGTGAGVSGAERFDLGEVRRITAIRIVFTNPRRPSQAGEYRIEGAEARMGIDAVEAMR